jgi:HSP20 family protein
MSEIAPLWVKQNQKSTTIIFFFNFFFLFIKNSLIIIISNQSKNQKKPAHYSADPLERTWAHQPRCDIIERDGSIIITADIPGAKKEDIHVHYDEGVLTIKGVREEEKIVDKDNWTGTHVHRIERFKGEFVRTFQVPTGVNPSQIKAKVEHGVLRVSLPNPKPRGPAPAHAAIPIA